MAERVFVFGSNLAGVHGAGSAKAAAEKHGAERGVGVGPTGGAYAIPTKRTWRDRHPLSLSEIKQYVDAFIVYAAGHPHTEFEVVRIGCGLAGYQDHQIAPMFDGATWNVHLPFGWRELAALPEPTP